MNTSHAIARVATPPRQWEQGAETVAWSVLGLIASHPGQIGRLRSARIISGYPMDHDDPELARSATPFASVVVDWSLRGTISLIDALVDGGLLTQTAGARPLLVLTRAGFHALEALDASASAHA